MAWSTRTDASTLTRKGITTISIIIFTKLVNSQNLTPPPVITTSPSSTRTGSTSTTPTQTPTQAQPSSGVSAGAVAGIAIGCAVAGLVAGLLVACILLRRKKRRHSCKADAVATHHESKAYSPETTPPAAASDIQLKQFLPEATPDREIAQEMQSLGGLIHQHVENYYHSRTVNASTRDLSTTLKSLGFKGQSSSPDTYTKNIAALCLDPKTRQSGLRHVITRAIFSSIGFHTQTSLPSMLPQPVASFLQAMPPDELGHSADAQDSIHAAVSLALRRWRGLTVFLLHPRRNLRTPLPIDNAAVPLQAQELANSLDKFLGVFVDTDAGVARQQRAHLEAVIVECTRLGYVLLSHPCDWGFVTDVASTKEGLHGLVVEAGLDKLSGQDGPPYSHPRTMVEPVAVYHEPRV
ncbi:hypothetical protein MANI_022004 [Metarhizium anisopliae]